MMFPSSLSILIQFLPILDCRISFLLLKIEFIQTPIRFPVKPPFLLSPSDLIDQRPARPETRRVVARAAAVHEGEVDDVVQK